MGNTYSNYEGIEEAISPSDIEEERRQIWGKAFEEVNAEISKLEKQLNLKTKEIRRLGERLKEVSSALGDAKREKSKLRQKHAESIKIRKKAWYGMKTGRDPK